MVNANWPTAVAGEAEGVSSVSALALPHSWTNWRYPWPIGVILRQWLI